MTDLNRAKKERYTVNPTILTKEQKEELLKKAREPESYCIYLTRDPLSDQMQFSYIGKITGVEEERENFIIRTATRKGSFTCFESKTSVPDEDFLMIILSSLELANLVNLLFEKISVGINSLKSILYF